MSLPGLGPRAAVWRPRLGPPPRGGDPGGFGGVADASKPIDWNGNGVLTDKNLAFDVNGDDATSPPPTKTLTPFDDWKNLKLKGGSIGAGGDARQTMVTTVMEMTPEDIKLVLPADLAPPQTTAVVTPAPNAARSHRTDVTVPLTA